MIGAEWLRMGEWEHYRQRLRGAVASSAAPYGYTLVIWCSGAVAAHFRGIPATEHALMLAAGAITAFALVGLLAFGMPEHVLVSPKEKQVELWGAFHLPVVAASLGIATLLANFVHNAILAWLFVGFAATATYLLVIALQYMLAERRADKLGLRVPGADAVRRSVDRHERA